MSFFAETFNADHIIKHIKNIILVWFLYILGMLSGFMFLIFLFMGSYTIIDLSLSVQEALVLDTLLSILFFLQHSIMVRKGFKNRLGKFLPDVYHNALYGIFSTLTLMLILMFWQAVPLMIANAEGIFFWLLRTIFLVCMLGFLWGAKALGSFDALGVRPLMRDLGKQYEKTQNIIAKGPYRWSRHPLYFLMIIIIWACPILTADRLIFNVLWSLWIVMGTCLEDRDLRREFGSQYIEYSSHVPMLIPYKIWRNKHV